MTRVNAGTLDTALLYVSTHIVRATAAGGSNANICN